MSKELTTKISSEALELLNNSFPVEQGGFERILLPRLGMYAQNQMEGKGKAMKVVTEAGTFYTENKTDKTDDEGKSVWEKKELGDTIEGIIIYQRKQLRYYDQSTETFTSSPIFDNDDEIIPLFCNKAEVARGTAKELKARPEYQEEKDGKVKSKLEENKVLYVLYNNELHQMTLRGSSMFAYKTYIRTVINPSVFVTKFSSEAKEKGSIEWNQMTFTKIRQISQEEAEKVIDFRGQIINAIKAEKSFFADNAPVKDNF